VTFPGILGHGPVIARLAQAAVGRRPHHAYIFHGPEGVGRRRVALALARALNCDVASQPTLGLDTGNAPAFCGACPSCKRIDAATDPDVWTVSPSALRGGGPRSLRVDVVRETRGRLAYRLPDERFRVVVFDDTELMTVNAANSLLKTLEEPPERTVIVLITRRLGQLLPTVRSRCLQVAFGRLDVGQVTEYLVERAGLPREEAEQRAAASGGAIGRALTLSLDEMAAERELLERLFAAQQARTPVRMELAAEIARAQAEARRANNDLLRGFLTTADEVIRDALAMASAPDLPLRRPDCQSLAHELCTGYDAAILLRRLEGLEQARDRLERNVNPQLVLEAMLLEVA
jgi:DNA polymerase-3 subunit delta'